MSMRGFEILPEHKERINELLVELNLRKDEFMPRRGTLKSAGYDIRSIQDITIAPGTKEAVETGITAFMPDNEELSLRPRSGTAYNFDITLQNAPGTVDADYYDKGGHIKVLVRNEGTEPFVIAAGDRICQGLFGPYYITHDDNPADQLRTGGLGHTGVK
jgi:dUTP pyrophosphatase